IYATLIACILALYWPVLHFGFISYDDPDYVTSNTAVRSGLNWNSVLWAFRHTSSAEWHPVTMLSHELDCQLFGLNPAGHHLTNLVLHTANSLILFSLLCYLSRAVWPSALVAFLFAVHPVNVETVAWISERKGLLSTFFGLSCLLAYARYAKSAPATPCELEPGEKGACSVPSIPGLRTGRQAARSTVSFYGLALIFLALGLLSKPMLVTWPFVMLLLDVWPLRRLAGPDFKNAKPVLRHLLVEKLPFFALALASAAATFLVARSWGAVTDSGQTSFSIRLSNSLVAYGLYIGKLIWPTNLSIDYPFRWDWPALEVITCVTVLLIVTIVVLLGWKRRLFLMTGWAWYLGTLVPVIGVFHFGNHFMADRYEYLTTIGLMIMICWTGASLVKTQTTRFLAILCSVASVVGCLIVARHQLGFWRNTQALFEHALAVNPKDFVALNNLGFYFDERGDAAKAEQYYRAALSISPGSTFALEKLAVLLISKGKYADAVSTCETALKLDPGMADAHCTLGLALMKEGKRDAAVEQYLESLRIRPDFAPAHYNLANALASIGQFDQAVEHYRACLRWDPDSADAHNNLAFLLARIGRLDEAEVHFQAALQLKPDFWQAEFGLAEAFLRQQNVAGAQHHYQETLKRRPDFPQALVRLAWSLATSPDPRYRNGKQAVILAERACALTEYKQSGPLQTLAACYAEVGDYKKALDYAQQAQKLAMDTGQTDLAHKLQTFIDLFAAGKPYREQSATMAN
ncbi:MAG TPA: tetratricopeptide repeat protein, partial [Patescibacteria group bacterium]|nr:tetratricopeptide repeat protein [Patescibacteria group bacterium]